MQCIAIQNLRNIFILNLRSKLRNMSMYLSNEENIELIIDDIKHYINRDMSELSTK